MNVEAEQRAIEVRVRAERRVGQLLAELEKGKGGQPKKNSDHAGPSSFARTKQEAKTSGTQATRWQRLATIPSDKFERKLSDTTKIVTRIAIEPSPTIAPELTISRGDDV